MSNRLGRGSERERTGTARPSPRSPRLRVRRMVLALLLAACAFLGGGPPPGVRAQDDVPPATLPTSLSQRLRAQGHAVEPTEAAYLDADERLTESFVQPLVVVLAFANQPSRHDDWRLSVRQQLQQLVRLDPLRTPVIPPVALQGAHTQAVLHRHHLRAAAEAWLVALEADDPEWLQRGGAEYAAAESARIGWHRALWERYVGQPLPAP